MKGVSVIGAGLAGCEAAYQLAERGISVSLYEMKPSRRSPAHHSDSFAELVCSNSLRADRLQNGPGLLKEEMRRLNSLIMNCADASRVPAGGALAVDREEFSRMVTERIRSHPNINVINCEISQIPEPPAVVATGPLTDGAIADAIEALFGDSLHFYDAAAPLVSYATLDHAKVFRASRYGRGGDDYLNCPMNSEEYFAFIRALTQAETVPLKEFEKLEVFEGCMPVEVMAKRGDMTLAYGPLKPVGLRDSTGNKPFAVVQLRQDNKDGTLYNIVGFQTNLKFAEQKRVFSMIPGLENAEFIRYGVMHRNTFINSPGKLGWDYQCLSVPGLYFAGQMTGVEGYIESAASGLAAGINLARFMVNKPGVDFTNYTAMGALGHYIAEYGGRDFQPMNITFGIIAPLENAPRNKQLRYELLSKRALARLSEIIENNL